jgi:hypothetical protein
MSMPYVWVTGMDDIVKRTLPLLLADIMLEILEMHDEH